MTATSYSCTLVVDVLSGFRKGEPTARRRVLAGALYNNLLAVPKDLNRQVIVYFSIAPYKLSAFYAVYQTTESIVVNRRRSLLSAKCIEIIDMLLDVGIRYWFCGASDHGGNSKRMVAVIVLSICNTLFL